MPFIASVGEFAFGGVRSVDAATVATTETPEGMKPQLHDLANLPYKPARFGYAVTLNQASAGGSADLRLTDGNNTLATVTLDLSAAQDFTGVQDVDLAGVEGQSKLRWEFEVTNAADASTVAQVSARLEVRQPGTVTGC
ncbi:MAG: hypothetical protein MI745_06665 [Pseudomonadales bacterium]|nr:hypothetical protein [Pseudomonadales bacterium]